MLTTSHSLPFIGRTEILEQLIERLLRPDDLRNNPKEFIHPGLYSLAGTGKSRLLHEVAERGRTITPYIVKLDFDTLSGSAIPSTPLKLLQYLIDILEELDRGARPFWRRLFWRWSNPFNECRQIIQHFNISSVTQVINLASTQASNIAQSINLGSTIPDNLNQAFPSALANLYVKTTTKVEFGNFGNEKWYPLILILLDTVELAPKPIRHWLSDIYSLTGGKNTLHFHLMFVIAGRYQQAGVLETLLPPLAHAEAKAFVREYASYLLNRSQNQSRSGALTQLLDSDAVQSSLASQGQGIPLLLQLLVDTAALAPDIDEMLKDEDLPTQHDTCVHFVIENYLERLKNQAYLQKDDQLWRHYYLLLYCAIPSRIPNTNFLRALLKDLTGTTFSASTNYDELFEELLHEGFVEQAKDDALIFHSIVREGIQAYLQANDPELFKLLHARAASWFHDNNDRINYLYHGLRSDPAKAFEDLRASVAEAMEQKQLSRVQNLISTTIGASIGTVEKGWIRIYKADLAWAENNQHLALDRLRKLYDQEEVQALDNDIALRLERWLGFDQKIETELQQGQAPALSDEYLSDLLWWAEQRNLPFVKAYALRALGEESIAQWHFNEARELLSESLEISRQLKDVAACAYLSRQLGELSLMLGPFPKAEEFFQQAIKLYEVLGQAENQCRAQAALAVALFYEGRQDDARQLLDLTLKRQQELQDAAGQGHTLRVLGQMEFLTGGLDRYETAEDLLNKALDLFKQVADALGQAQVLMLLSELIFAMRSHPDKPLDRRQEIPGLCLQAAELYRKTTDRLGAAHIQYLLGKLAAMHIYENNLNSSLDAFDIAVIHYKQARSLYRSVDDDLSAAHTQVAMGAILYTLWKRHDKALGEAKGALQDALEIYEEYNDALGKAGVLLIFGQFALWKLEYEEAEKLLNEAAQLFSSVGTPFAITTQAFANDLLEMARKNVIPDKSRLHIGYIGRCRAMDLSGWSLVARRELVSVYIIYEVDKDVRRRFKRFGGTAIFQV